MSHSPLSPEAALSPYGSGWAAVGWLIRQGESWSGHERDVAFLGDGRGNFLEAGAALGLDPDADGRSVARVDWDGDGDLDLWVRSRTEPRVRYYENQVPRRGHWVRAKLIAPTHALGARLEVAPMEDQGANAQPWLRTVRAGEGYLSQSSDWLHVGVGDQREVRLAVVWPGGVREDFGALSTDRAVILKQGEGRWREGPAGVPLGEALAANESETTANPTVPLGRVVLAAPHPLPTLRVQSPSGKQLALGGMAAYREGKRQRPAIVLVWSEDCAPCAKELAHWSRLRETVQNVGLGVIALQVPAAQDSANTPRSNWLEKIQWPYSQAQLTDESTRLVHALADYFTDRTGPLAVPMSFLLDERGQVQVLYFGLTQVETVLGDTRLFGLAGPERLRQALPFEGLHLEPPKEPRWNRWAQYLAARQLPDQARELQLARVSTASLDGAEAQFRIGQARLRQGLADEALTHLQAAVEMAPEDGRFQGSLGLCYQTLDRPEEALQHLQVALVQDPKNRDWLQALGEVQCDLENFQAALRTWQTLRPLDHAASLQLKQRIDAAQAQATPNPEPKGDAPSGGDPR